MLSHLGHLLNVDTFRLNSSAPGRSQTPVPLPISWLLFCGCSTVMQMTSRTIVINFAEHQQNGRKLKANPQAKKEENRRKLEPGIVEGCVVCLSLKYLQLRILSYLSQDVHIHKYIHTHIYVCIPCTYSKCIYWAKGKAVRTLLWWNPICYKACCLSANDRPSGCLRMSPRMRLFILPILSRARHFAAE